MNIITNDDLKCPFAITALKQVDDPEIGLNVVDLGLIYHIEFDEEKKMVRCRMTLTTQFCPMGESIIAGITNALQSVFEEYEIDVFLTFDPPWSHDMISEEGREFLNG